MVIDRRTMSTDYETFIQRKSHTERGDGFAPLWMPDVLFDFQRHLVDWALMQGRAAVFADCGLGKTPIQLVWAENVLRHTNRPVLIVTPLAVSSQTVREGTKFGVEVHRAVHGQSARGIAVTNYERLHQHDPANYDGIVLDESSILKSFDGVTRAKIVEFMRGIRYRLLCTATAAPNDYVELGNSSEALGYLGFMDMLGKFFKNDRNNSATARAWGKGGNVPHWHFRGHAEKHFWRWVVSWARAVRKPSDLGYDDSRFTLPRLVEREHVVKARAPRQGMMFSMPAVGLQEEREERRRTLTERCELAAALVANTGKSAVSWCHLNDEADLVTRLVPGAVQVSGKDSDEQKEEKFNAFATGEIRVLVTKPVIGAWGLNWQHCAHMTSFAGHSFEQYYQSLRRFYRFGQTESVTADHVLSDGEERVLANLRRKAEQADRMFAELAANVTHAIGLSVSAKYDTKEVLPSWL
jgi:hypothetical protein